MKSVEVEIFGRRFRLRSDNPERTKHIAEEIDRQIEDLSKLYDNLDFTKLLLLICLQQQEEVLSFLTNFRNKETNKADTIPDM